jgi:hypothetical protein
MLTIDDVLTVPSFSSLAAAVPELSPHVIDAGGT